ncbi:MAG: histone deacetylase [Bryobacteraceae bacterium]|nr:histone deacetylase [Bryobacteraceae bacterium]
MQIVHHPHYDLEFGPHVFPSRKFELVRRALDLPLAVPAPATRGELLLVHTPAWIDSMERGLTPPQSMTLEAPWSPAMARAFFTMTGGTILAARLALRDGVAFNCGGGFHHAFPHYGEGFCAIHDVAVAIRVLQREGAIRRAMVVDTDVHHGNGTAAIFGGDPSVFTISLHQYANYPSIKPPSSIDVNLEDGTGDEEYLRRLREVCEWAMAIVRPELVIYIAGADPYFDDQLGGLSLTMDGLAERDRIVFSTARANGAAVAITLAGGYARKLEDTVAIHAATARVAATI